MKTSTKNALIKGVFSIVTGVIGLFAGYNINSNIENSKIVTMLSQSGIITINNNSSNTEIVSKLIDTILADKEELKSLSIKITDMDNLNKDLDKEINNKIDKIEELENKNTLLENEKISLREENEQLKNTILEYQKYQDDKDNISLNKDDDEFVSLLSVCEPYYKTPHVYIIDSYVKMCGNTYSNGLNMACDGYYALFNLEGKYNKMKFDAGHIDGTVMSYGEVHIYVDDLKSNPVIIPIDPEGIVEGYEIELNGATQLKIATVANKQSIGVGIVNIEVK